jgi:bacillithiol biosynthesis cysteine-adding enzyme BshC
MRLTPLATLPVGEIPGTPRFFRELARRPSPLAPFLSPVDSPLHPVPPVALSPGYAESLLRENRSWGAPPETERSIAKLAAGAGVVVTGQQAGLLFGPFYTLVKAAQAVATAAALERSTGHPHVPVFWSETEDHDLAEVNRCGLHGKDGVMTLGWPFAGVPPDTPVGTLPLTDGAKETFLDSLASALPATGFTDELLAWIWGNLGGAATWGEWFNRTVLSLLGRYGLVIVDSLSPAFKAEVLPASLAILARAGEISASVNATGERLLAIGIKPQVHMVRGRLPFFLLEGGRRLKANMSGDAIESGGRRRSVGEIAALLRDDPGAFSANVVSRPLLIGAAFGAALHVTGPSETAYFAQVMPSFDLLGIPQPSILPRTTMTLIEPAVARAMEGKGGLAPEDLLFPEAMLAKRLAGPSRGPFGDRFWGKWEKGALGPFADIKGRFPENSRPFAAASRGEAQTRSLLEGLRKAVEKESEEGAAGAAAKAARIALLIRPGGVPQERVYSPVSFFNRHGLGLTDALVEVLPADWREHHLLRVEG